MKVLKNNFNKVEIINGIIEPYPRQWICAGCESELEYEESDIEMGVYGCMHLKCPLCGENNMLCNNERNITLTAENVEFPTHFWHTSKENGAVDCFNNEKIKKYIKRAIEYFRLNKDKFAWGSGSGNTTIHVYRHPDDEEYHVVTSNNYYSTFIPFEPEDYQ